MMKKEFIKYVWGKYVNGKQIANSLCFQHSEVGDFENVIAWRCI